MIIAVGQIYQDDPGFTVLIDTEKLKGKQAARFLRAIQRAITKELKCDVVSYDVAQHESVFAAFVEPPAYIEDVITLFVE